MDDELARLWSAFGLQVTCGPLVMRPLRDSDFPEVLAVVHAGIHAPDLMPFSFPWSDARGAEMDRQFVRTTGGPEPSWPPSAGSSTSGSGATVASSACRA